MILDNGILGNLPVDKIANIQIQTHTDLHTHKHTRTHARIHTHTHTHTRTWRWQKAKYNALHFAKKACSYFKANHHHFQYPKNC